MLHQINLAPFNPAPAGITRKSPFETPSATDQMGISQNSRQGDAKFHQHGTGEKKGEMQREQSPSPEKEQIQKKEK